MSGARYTVSRFFRTKREASKYAKDARDDGYGARISKIEKNSRFNPPYRYQVRRSDYPIKRR